MRKSEIYAGANIYVKQVNYAVDGELAFGPAEVNGRDFVRVKTTNLEEYKAGRIVVYNNSSKKIWVRVDADWIDQTKQSASHSLETSLGIPGEVSSSE